MSLVRVHNMSVSLDGFATGEGQSLASPFGHAGTRLTEWFFPTATFQGMTGDREREPVSLASEPDDRFARRWGENIGAEIMGANKFGPPGWQDDPEWRGWWGDNPPFHTPVVVLTHHERAPLECEGDNTFYFVNASNRDALTLARELAGDRDVRIGGGPTTVRGFLAEGLIDLLHVAVVPIILGRGVRLWDGLEGLERDFTVESETTPSGITHITFTKAASR